MQVLFVCVHNAGRSQMAAALLDRRAHGHVHVRSAGSAPGETISPAVAEAMDELGIDLSAGDRNPSPTSPVIAPILDRRAIGVPFRTPGQRFATATLGQSRKRADLHRRRVPAIPKLTVGVRFPSPAPL
jgi:hypothetical protein